MKDIRLCVTVCAIEDEQRKKRLERLERSFFLRQNKRTRQRERKIEGTRKRKKEEENVRNSLFPSMIEENSRSLPRSYDSIDKDHLSEILSPRAEQMQYIDPTFLRNINLIS